MFHQGLGKEAGGRRPRETKTPRLTVRRDLRAPEGHTSEAAARDAATDARQPAIDQAHYPAWIGTWASAKLKNNGRSQPALDGDFRLVCAIKSYSGV